MRKEGWHNIETVVKTVDNLKPRVSKFQWISAGTSELIDARRLIITGPEHDEERKLVKCKLTRRLGNNREEWWATKVEEMEEAWSLTNTRQLFRLIRNELENTNNKRNDFRE